MTNPVSHGGIGFQRLYTQNLFVIVVITYVTFYYCKIKEAWAVLEYILK